MELRLKKNQIPEHLLKYFKKAPAPGPNYKPGDLVNIPHLVAEGLRRDGWILRQDIIWAKPSPMPESVKSRCTKAHEYVFLFAKKGGYFCDMEAVKEKCSEEQTEHYQRYIDRIDKGEKTNKKSYKQNAAVGKPDDPTVSPNAAWGDKDKLLRLMTGSNKRSVWKIDEEEFQQFLEWKAMNSGNKLDWWNIASESYPGAHFATFPSKLITPMIKAGTSEKGCCSECGAPWKRVIEENKLTRERPNEFVKRDPRPKPHEKSQNTPGKQPYSESTTLRMNTCSNSVAGVETRTVGWEPSCECNGKFEKRKGKRLGYGSYHNHEHDGVQTGLRQDGKGPPSNPGPPTKEFEATIIEYIPSIPLEDHPVSPCIVLDPFAGSGTTNAVCITLGRNSIGIELSKDYLVKNAVPRIEGELLARPSLAYLVPRAARKSTMVGDDITG